MARWDADQNAFVEGDAVIPVASAARTANGDSGWLRAEQYDEVSLTLAVTAVGGDANETLDVIVETRKDSGDAARAVASFAQKTQPGGAVQERKTFAGLDQEYRVRWTVGGTTPSFTFSVSGEAK